ncbi:unnamed protein product (mitochondrion) [Plasmodiophora brassicae]|uniref:Transcription initiation factor IIF subunit alpha n=1 Tax=Plasmodiophora brassicae TaxID=37360 RepID=A0A3P3YL32_PLABS|nr:unnamed protein product [Plasmodiophora brassicae]
MSVPVYRLPSTKRYAIARFAPETVLSLKATTVSTEMVDSTDRRARGRKVRNFVLADKKNGRVHRAQPENVQARSKYVLLVQKGRKLFYTCVDLFKAAPKPTPMSEAALEEAERMEIERRERVESRLQRGHSRLNELLSKDGDDGGAPLLRPASRYKTAIKARHDLGLGDETRDADFEDEFDDDEEPGVTIDMTGAEPQAGDNEEEADLTAAGKKIAQILSKTDDMDEFSGSSDDEEMDENVSDSDVDEDDEKESQQAPSAAPATQVEGETRKRPLEEPAAERVEPKRTKAEAPAPAASDEVLVTEEAVRQQFRKHGRLTVKSLARNMEDSWKYKGEQARRQLMAIVKRICTFHTDPQQPSVKYLVLKP